MKHIRLRSFPTKCRYCGKMILYWESTRGAKVFFNLPIYGKPIRHLCRKSKNLKNPPIIKETALDHLKKKLEKQSFQCPVCGKICSTEKALNNHIHQMQKYDDPHAEFSEMLEFIDFNENSLNFKSNPQSSFKTNHSIKTIQDRFILKTHRKEDKIKFENLIRRKK
ncbi:MAG: hypothetical protein K9W44_03085 [Candidatus Lokiarchaeota archaeon]|nr:hypothetical protein [Candidatus Harpocratesius repetitus]